MRYESVHDELNKLAYSLEGEKAVQSLLEGYDYRTFTQGLYRIPDIVWPDDNIIPYPKRTVSVMLWSKYRGTSKSSLFVENTNLLNSLKLINIAKETKMAIDNNTPFMTIEYAYGCDITTLTHAQLIGMINRATNEKNALASLPPSKRVELMVKGLDDTVAKLVAKLDEGL